MRIRTISAAATLLLALAALLSGCKPRQPATQAAEPGLSNGAPVEVGAAYRSFAIAQCDGLVKAVREFSEALAAGDVARGRQLYAPARTFYERIEPIAEALGTLDPFIDGREGDQPDVDWRGFHRIEKILWKGGSPEDLDRFGRLLLEDVSLLRAKVETVPITTAFLITGSVELLNEVASTKLTGEEDRYSHTDLYDIAANVEGAREIYRLLSASVAAKNADLARRIEAGFRLIEEDLSVHKVGNGWASYTSLTPDQTRKLGRDIDALADSLSRIAGLAAEAP
jgi:iron uptake system component EfeO